MGRTQIGLAIGIVAGLLAGWGARGVQLAFGLLVAAAGLNSWWVMLTVVGFDPASGHGIAPGYVVMTVLSWVLAFAAFFGAAWLVRWRSHHN